MTLGKTSLDSGVLLKARERERESPLKFIGILKKT